MVVSPLSMMLRVPVLLLCLFALLNLANGYPAGLEPDSTDLEEDDEDQLILGTILKILARPVLSIATQIGGEVLSTIINPETLPAPAQPQAEENQAAATLQPQGYEQQYTAPASSADQMPTDEMQ